MTLTLESINEMSLEELVDLIRLHSDKYYNGESEISDTIFDAMIAAVKEQDPENEVLSEVGAEIPSWGKKVTHEDIMGSLSKITFDEDSKTDHVFGLTDWCESNCEDQYIAYGPKIDGLAIRLVYDGGKLILAATRGNGSIGQDVTDNIRACKSIPNEISFKEKVELRGEIYMKKSDFYDFRTKMIENGEKAPANPRNMASGTLLQKDPKETGKRNLSFFVYDITTEDRFADNEYDLALQFPGLFHEFEYVPVNLICMDGSRKENEESIFNLIKAWEKERDALPYCIDGLVFSVNKFSTQIKLGYKGKRPNGKIAFKFRPTQKEALLIDINWQIGRTGRFTPVAVLDPIELDGSIVKNPTLHNYTQLLEKNIRIGDTVLVEKAGDIIPQVVKVVKHDIEGDERNNLETINYPRICPCCFQETELDGANVICSNPNCSGQKEFRILHFLKTLKVYGVGKGLVKLFLDNNIISSIPDLFRIESSKLLCVDGIQEKYAGNIVKAINEKRTVPLAVFLDALGISGLGTTTSKMIAKEYRSLEAVLLVNEAQLLKLDGIGETTAYNIINGLNKCGEMIAELSKLITIEDVEVVKGNLTGKSFCITGTLSVSRNEMQSFIEKNGGTIKSSVSKGLDYLVAGDDVGKTKTDKAAQYGTTVISEAELRKMVL